MALPHADDLMVNMKDKNGPERRKHYKWQRNSERNRGDGERLKLSGDVRGQFDKSGTF